MKALSLTQPWATLIAIRAKQIETRSWPTRYRGLIAIHASKGYPKWARETCAEEPFYSVLQDYGRRWIAEHHGQSPRAVFEDPVIPTGMIIAVARVADVRRILSTRAWLTEAYRPVFTEQERAFGDYAPDRYAWLLSDIQKLPIPIPCKGALGLWEVPAQIYEAIALQLLLLERA